MGGHGLIVGMAKQPKRALLYLAGRLGQGGSRPREANLEKVGVTQKLTLVSSLGANQSEGRGNFSCFKRPFLTL